MPRALRVKSGVVRNHSPAWARFAKEIRSMKGVYLKVGYLGSGERTEEGLTMPQLAAVHEFGAPEVNVPARPHLGPSFDRNREKYVSMLAGTLERWYSGSLTLQQSLSLLGTVMVADIRTLVTTGPGIAPPNAPSTLARKMAKGEKAFRRKRRREGPVESPRPLVDTGRMLAALTYVVVTGRGDTPEEG